MQSGSMSNDKHVRMRNRETPTKVKLQVMQASLPGPLVTAVGGAADTPLPLRTPPPAAHATCTLHNRMYGENCRIHQSLRFGVFN